MMSSYEMLNFFKLTHCFWRWSHKAYVIAVRYKHWFELLYMDRNCPSSPSRAESKYCVGPYSHCQLIGQEGFRQGAAYSCKIFESSGTNNNAVLWALGIAQCAAARKWLLLLSNSQSAGRIISRCMISASWQKWCRRYEEEQLLKVQFKRYKRPGILKCNLRGEKILSLGT